ncbi:hypothetical protein ACWC9H_27125 [Streptomyces sp. NPDC001251]
MADPQRDAQNEPEKTGPFGSKWFIASAAFVAGVVLLGVLVAVRGGGSPGDSPARAAPPAPSTPASTASPSGPALPPGVCPALTDTDSHIPLNPPTDNVTWSIVDGWALPASRTAGPAQVNGDVARCYAHTPVGALLASVQITARAMSAKDWRAIADQQMVGDGKANYISTRADFEKTQGTSAAVGPDEHGQLAAFKYVTYSPDTAVVELVWRAKTGALGAGAVTLRWDGGDWKNEVAISAPPAKQVDNLAGYIAWGGI